MMVCRSDKYMKPVFTDNNLVLVTRRFGGDDVLISKCKYVDIDQDYVYLYDGANHSVTPTFSTLAKMRREKVSESTVSTKA